MSENKNTRLILLAVAGGLLIGGVNIWQRAQMQKQEEITAVQPRKHRSHKMAKKPISKDGDKTQSKSLDADKLVDAIKVPVGTPGAPVPTVATSAAKPPNAQTTTTTISVSPGGLAIPAAPAVPDKIAALQRTDAQVIAAKSAGRNDPFHSVTGFKPFPTKLNMQEEEELSMKGTKGKAKSSKHFLVPPPPPVVHSFTPPAIPPAEMPEPPTRPLLAQKVKLVAVVGDRAILKITDKRLRMDNRWPATITLGAGDKYESMEVVRVMDDSVTLEEDGERLVKTLDRVR